MGQRRKPHWCDGPRYHVIGGATVATELDAKRAIREGAELAARALYLTRRQRR